MCDPRAAPPGEHGLKSGENGHLARANGAIGGPCCSPTWPSVFGRRYESLAGRGGGFGGGAAPAPTRGAWGTSSIRLAKKNARRPGPGALCPKAWPGWLSYAALSQAGQEEQSNGFATIHKGICRLGALKSTFPAVVQSELPETGSGAGRPVRRRRTPIPAPIACPGGPLPRNSKHTGQGAVITA
jgi:hypothetical protein